MIAADFEKAFDTVSWNFMFRVLEKFNFGPDFIRWVKVCYTDISSCVVNNKVSSPYFPILRGLRQGDSMSSFLFLLVAEVMSHAIRTNTKIRGVIYDNEEIKLVSFADDTTLIVLGEEDAKEVFKYFKIFEKASGLKLNKLKTEGLWLGSYSKNSSKPFGIKWPSVVKILGIRFSHDAALMQQRNFDDKLEKIIKNLIYGK
jgi:hypothetical protein